MKRALIIVDVQVDFCEGGSLPVTGGADVARRISEYVQARRNEYAAVVATRDYHEDPGAHFAAEPDYRDSWPAHCVVGTTGADFHPNLTVAVDEVFSKGRREAAYSGFEGVSSGGQPLASWLEERGIEQVDVVGIATDHCVRATALDAARSGLGTRVLVDLTAGVAPETTSDALDQLAGAGVHLAGSTQS